MNGYHRSSSGSLARWGKRLAALLLILALAAGALAASLALFPPQGVLILEYHKVNDWNTDAYTVSTAEFAAQLDALQAEGYTTISLLDFLRAKKGKQKLPEKPVILTFDDGYMDNYTEMLPLLESRGMKGTVFMVTNFIGKPGYLSWEALRDMQQRGMEIGSHTANHLPLTEMSPKEAEEEISRSKLILEWNGLREIYGLSYPNGQYAPYLPEILRRHEYLAAVTGDPGLNTMATEPYLLQRTNIPRPRLGLTEFWLRIWRTKAMARLGLYQH